MSKVCHNSGQEWIWFVSLSGKNLLETLVNLRGLSGIMFPMSHPGSHSFVTRLTCFIFLRWILQNKLKQDVFLKSWSWERPGPAGPVSTGVFCEEELQVTWVAGAGLQSFILCHCSYVANCFSDLLLILFFNCPFSYSEEPCVKQSVPDMLAVVSLTFILMQPQLSCSVCFMLVFVT